jgi:hypothetical protein
MLCTTFWIGYIAKTIALMLQVGPSSRANTTKTQPAVKRKREAEDGATAFSDAEMQLDVDAALAVTSRKVTCKRDTVGVAANRLWKLPAEKRSSASQKRTGRSWNEKVCIMLDADCAMHCAACLHSQRPMRLSTVELPPFARAMACSIQRRTLSSG